MNNKKYKYTYLLILLAFFLLFTGCNKGPEYNKLIPFQEEEDGKWGYVNFKGRKKIETKFANQPSLFYKSMALIRNTDGTYDFINSKGIDMGKSFKSATSFKGGVACAVNEDKYPVIIDKNLEVVAELDSVEEVSGFSEGLAAFMSKNDKWGYINNTGEVVIKPVYHDAAPFREGLALVGKKIEEYDSTKKENKTKLLKGYINKNGDEAISLSEKFYRLSSFSNGLAAYSDGIRWGWGFINKKGDKVIRANAEWEDVTLFHEGLASVKINGYWGLINKKGKIIINPKYDSPLYFSNGLASFELDDKTGFIDEKGKIVIDPEYDDVAMDFYSGKSIVLEGVYYKFINRKGKSINDIELYNVELSSDYHHIVESDYFDVNPIIDTLFTELSPNSVLGLNGKSNVQAVLDKFNMTKDNLPQNTWREYISLSSVSMKDAEIEKTINFTSSVSTPIKKKVSYSYYYSYYETVGYKPNSQSLIESITFEIRLTKRGYDKEEKLAMEFKNLFEANGYSKVEGIEIEGKKYVLASQDDGCKVVIDYDDTNKVEISFNF